MSYFIRLSLVAWVLMLSSTRPAKGNEGYSGVLEGMASESGINTNSSNPSASWGYPTRLGYGELRSRFEKGVDNESMLLEARYRFDYLNSTGDLFVDQAYIGFRPTPPLRIRTGMQRLGFGVGYLWSVVNDLDPRRDPFNPTRYNSGVVALAGTWVIDSFVGFPLGLSFEILPKEPNPNQSSSFHLGSQIRALLGGVDLGLVASATGWDSERPDALFGMYGSMEWLGFIWGSEMAYSRKLSDSLDKSLLISEQGFEFSGILSLNKRLSKDAFVVLEYCHDGHGYRPSGVNALIDLAKASGPVNGLYVYSKMSPGYTSRDYLFSALSWGANDHWVLGVVDMLNLNNPGGLVSPRLMWNTDHDISVSVESPVVFAGSGNNEFAAFPYTLSVITRFQYFF